MNIATKLDVSDVMEGNKSCQNMHRLKPHKAGSGIQTTGGDISFMLSISDLRRRTKDERETDVVGPPKTRKAAAGSYAFGKYDET